MARVGLLHVRPKDRLSAIGLDVGPNGVGQLTAYYNEHDPYCVAWLWNLIDAKIIPGGYVDNRSIKDVQASDLRGFTQCHFFAGIGGWPFAARLAGWPDERPLWTGSCPCQPFSQAGRRRGTDDARDLWPDLFRLARAARPAVLMGEQVAGALGYDWFYRVWLDMAGEAYDARTVDIPACAVDAPHIRNRMYWVTRDPGQCGASALADDNEPIVCRQSPTRQLAQPQPHAGALANADVGQCDGRSNEQERGPEGRTIIRGTVAGRGVLQHAASIGWGEGKPEPIIRGGGHTTAGANTRDLGNAKIGIWRAGLCEGGTIHDGAERHNANLRNGTFWSDAEWIMCHDGKARRAQPGIRLLADGIPARISKWRAAGNSIVPQEAAEVIAAFMDVYPNW